MFNLKLFFIVLIWTPLCHISVFASPFDFFSFILNSCPHSFYPGTLLPLGSCRWTEEVLHDQSKDHHGERCSVTALTTVWPTDQQGLSSRTQFLPDTPSPVPANHFKRVSSTDVNRITCVACCVFHLFVTPLYLVMYKAWGDEKGSESCHLMENNGAERE